MSAGEGGPPPGRASPGAGPSTTSWPAFAVARARASLGLLLTLLVLVTVTTGILAGAVGYSQAAATTSARGALTQGAATQAGVQVQTRLGEDPGAQDSAARGTIADAFSPAPVAVGRRVVSEPQPVTTAGRTLDGKVVLEGGPDLAPGAQGLEGLVEVVAGSWPGAAADGEGAGGTADAPLPGALHDGAAQAWGVGVGDVLVVRDRPVEVVALWRPVDAQDPAWFGDGLVRTGQVEADHGPLVVAEEAVAGVGAPFVRWTVRPQAASVSPDDLSVLADGAERLRAELRRADGVAVRGVTVEGDLAPTAAAAATNLATARALGVVPLSVLALVTGLAVVQLARLLATTREPQLQLLLARGASRAQLLGVGLAESALVALVGGLTGGLLARLLVLLLPGGEVPAVGRAVLATSGAALLGILLVLGAVAVLQARRLAAGLGIADRSGRARAATAAATVVLVLGAAGLAWWQLRRAGSPVVTRPDGSLGTDLVAGAAPALLLAAAAVVALALLGPLARLVELVARPARSTAGHLAAAQVSRRLQVYAVPAVLTVLAVGATTVASVYAGTSARLRDDLAAVGQGAPIRADVVEPAVVVRPGVLPPAPPTLADEPTLSAAAQVWHEPDARLGDATVPLTMADTTLLAAVTPAVDGASLVPPGLDRLTDASGLPQASADLPLPEGAREITVGLEARTSLDRWEIARLDGLREQEEQLQALSAELSPDDPAPPPVEQWLGEVLDGQVAELAAPQQLTVRLVLRDLATGLTYPVTAAEMQVAGPSVRYDPETLSDVVAEPAATAGGGTVTLPEGRELALAGVVVELPGGESDWWEAQRVLDLEVTARAGEVDLLAGATGWGSRELASPEEAAPAQAEADAEEDPHVRTVTEELPDGTRTMGIESNRVLVPPSVDTSAATWVVHGTLSMVPSEARGPDASLPETATIGPGLRWAGDASVSRGGAPPATQPAPSALVPVALTDAAARAAALQVGDRLEITFPGATVPARLARLVPAVPGQTGELAALADSRVVGAALSARGQELRWPGQLWAAPSGDAAAAVDALSARPDLQAVTGPGRVSVADATGAARLVFWVASAGAVLLAVTGIAAVAATLLTARRAEVAVLRALGMPPATQARARALELGGVVLAAVALGLAAGWLVSAAVVPELAASTTQAGGLSLPATLRLEVAPWTVLVCAGGLLMLAVLLLLSARVRTQALDGTYREEVR